MDGLNCMATREKEFEIDLESGGNTSEEDSCSEYDSSTEKSHGRKTFSRLRCGFTCHDGSINHGCNFASCSNSTKLGVNGNEDLLMDKSIEGEKRREHVAFLEKKKKNVKEKIKNGKVVHKPPRPPKGPLLDAADRILVKEITELAMRKRASIERIKALKKMKAEKSSSFNSSLPALFITLLFFVVIIFQGMSAKGSDMLPESHVPSVSGSESFISVQQFQSPHNIDGPLSHFPNPNFAEEQISDPLTIEEVKSNLWKI